MINKKIKELEALKKKIKEIKKIFTHREKKLFIKSNRNKISQKEKQTEKPIEKRLTDIYNNLVKEYNTKLMETKRQIKKKS